MEQLVYIPAYKEIEQLAYMPACSSLVGFKCVCVFTEVTSFTKVIAWLSLNDKCYNEASIAELPNEQIARYVNFTSYCELELNEMWLEIPHKEKWTCCVSKKMFSNKKGKFDWKVFSGYNISPRVDIIFGFNSQEKRGCLIYPVKLSIER